MAPPNPLKLGPEIGGLGEATELLPPDTSVVRHWQASSQKYRIFSNSTYYASIYSSKLDPNSLIFFPATITFYNKTIANQIQQAPERSF